MKLLKFKCNKSIFGVFTDIFVICRQNANISQIIKLFIEIKLCAIFQL